MAGALTSVLQRLRGQMLVGLLLGLVAVLAFAPFEGFWLAPLVIAALFHLALKAASRRAAFLTGWAFGVGLFGGGVSWVYVSLSEFGGMPVWLAALGAGLFCLLLAFFPALALWAFRHPRLDQRERQARAVAFAAVLALADWSRGWFLSGFPWLVWGYSQTPSSPLAAYAPVLGVYGVSLLLLLVGACLLAGRRGWGVAGAIVLCGLGLGQMRWTQPQGEPISVALVQGNVAQDMKWQAGQYLATLERYVSLVAAHPAQLTVLPETAIPGFFDELPSELPEQLRALAARQQGDVLLGVLTGDRHRYWNSAVSLGRSPLQMSSKRHLVPFGEFIPPGFSWFLRVAHIPMAGFTPGPGAGAVLHLAGLPLAVNICYEDVFGEEIIEALPQAGVLVNLSNTAWFGRSLAQPQHLQIARLRALESGRPMLRATNTGMTAAISPSGEVTAVLLPFTTGVLSVSVQAWTGLTPYARWGNLPAVLMMLALLGWRRRGRAST